MARIEIVTGIYTETLKDADKSIFQNASNIYFKVLEPHPLNSFADKEQAFVSFGYDSEGDFFHPKTECWGTIECREYSWEELDTVIMKKESVVSCSVEMRSSAQSSNMVADMVVREKAVDYSQTITELEEKGLVETRGSKMWLTTDGRVFRITSSPDDEWFEVDMLWSSFCDKKLRDEIHRLYSESK